MKDNKDDLITLKGILLEVQDSIATASAGQSIETGLNIIDSLIKTNDDQLFLESLKELTKPQEIKITHEEYGALKIAARILHTIIGENPVHIGNLEETV